MAMGQYGVHPESLPKKDVVSPSLRKQILEGKDVNLACLLISDYEISYKLKHDNKFDNRLSRNLTITEFMTAFGKYKRVMSSVYPQRRAELDDYEANILEIYNYYGSSKFYEYHKMFAAKSAAALREDNIVVDWSQRDKDLLYMIVAGSRTNECKMCGSFAHSTPFCHMQIQTKSTHNQTATFKDRETDIKNRPRIMADNKEICNNFNLSPKGCTRTQCPYYHVCIKCRAHTHGSSKCTAATNKTPKPGI